MVHTLCLALDSRWLQLTDLRELSSSLLRHKAQHIFSWLSWKKKIQEDDWSEREPVAQLECQEWPSWPLSRNTFIRQMQLGQQSFSLVLFCL